MGELRIGDGDHLNAQRHARSPVCVNVFSAINQHDTRYAGTIFDV